MTLETGQTRNSVYSIVGLGMFCTHDVTLTIYEMLIASLVFQNLTPCGFILQIIVVGKNAAFHQRTVILAVVELIFAVPPSKYCFALLSLLL